MLLHPPPLLASESQGSTTSNVVPDVRTTHPPAEPRLTTALRTMWGGVDQTGPRWTTLDGKRGRRARAWGGRLEMSRERTTLLAIG